MYFIDSAETINMQIYITKAVTSVLEEMTNIIVN